MNDEKRAFDEMLISSPTLDDLVILATNSGIEPQSMEELAECYWMNGDQLVNHGYVLVHQWQRERVYMAFQSDVWESVEFWADDRLERAGESGNIISVLSDEGFGDVIRYHTDFVSVMLTIAFSVVAEDILAQEEEARDS